MPVIFVLHRLDMPPTSCRRMAVGTRSNPMLGNSSGKSVRGLVHALSQKQNEIITRGQYRIMADTHDISRGLTLDSRVLEGIGSPEVSANRAHQVDVPFGLLRKIAHEAGKEPHQYRQRSSSSR